MGRQNRPTQQATIASVAALTVCVCISLVYIYLRHAYFAPLFVSIDTLDWGKILAIHEDLREVSRFPSPQLEATKGLVLSGEVGGIVTIPAG